MKISEDENYLDNNSRKSSKLKWIILTLACIASV